MPRFYEYLGINVFFYSNEYQPVHVHGRYQGKESKFEILIQNVEIMGIRTKIVEGESFLIGLSSKYFRNLLKLILTKSSSVGLTTLSTTEKSLQRLSTRESNEWSFWTSDRPDRSPISSGLPIEASVLGWNRVLCWYFEPFLRRPKHSQIQSYLHLERFQQFQIVDRNLDWNDFELCFPLMGLYGGEL